MKGSLWDAERSESRTDLKAILVDFSDRILDSSVDRGIPNLAAAPAGPKTRPRLSLSAASIMFFSRARVLEGVQLVLSILLGRLLRQPTFIDRENLRFAKDHRALDNVL